jgi:sodium/pantothenate symporter
MPEPNFSTSFAFAAYIVITLFLAGMAHLRMKRQQFIDEFFVAGRSFGPWVLALTWVATMASGGSFVGAPALGWQNGWAVHLWIAGYMVITVTGMGILGKRIAFLGKETGAITMLDLIRDRFQSKGLATFLAVVTLFLYLSYLVAQYVAGARVMEVALGIPYWVGLLVLSVTVTVYTAFGGLRAVAWTDAFQATIMLGGILITFAFAMQQIGGFEAVNRALGAKSPELLSLPGPNNFLPISQAISFFFVWSLTALGQPALISRFLSTGDPGTVGRATFFNATYVILLYPAIMTLGVLSRVLVPDIAAPDQAMPATIVRVVPGWLAGIVLAAPFAAVMSTISSFLLVTGGTIVRDLYQRNLKDALDDRKARMISQGTTFTIGTIALIIAFRPPEYLQYIVVFSVTGLAATYLAPTVMAVFWPRATRAGAIAAVASGLGTFALQYALYGTRSWLEMDPFIWSLAFSLLAGVVVSLATAPPSREIRQLWFGED